ncbi:MAG TPA: ATP-binding protein [Catenuloplanes sp.]
MDLTATVTPELPHGLILVTLRGTLTEQSAPTVRAVLRKCLAEYPDAVIVDVRDLRTDSRVRLAVFPAAVRAFGPPPALLLHGAGPELLAMMRGRLLGDIPHYDTLGQARAAMAGAAAGATRRMTLRLPPTLSAAAQAREMVSDACRAWRTTDLSGPATQIISELVSNAVQHAGTDVHVGAALRGGFLHLSVRDYAQGGPTATHPQDAADGVALPERGRGLHLVGVYATAWGSIPTGDGKTVWATLRATAPPAR